LLSPLLAGDDDAVGVSVAAVLAALGGGVPAAALGFDIFACNSNVDSLNCG
jgi:hypothetical protein